MIYYFGGGDKMKIAVFCGASIGNKKEFKEDALRLGTWIGKNQHTLVYGGGNAGLMGILADSVLENGGEVIGVIPEFLVEREIAHQGLTSLYTVDNMHTRKKKMMDLTECFIALPGGPGTLEEISEVISWGRVGEHQKPAVFFDTNHYYQLIADFYTQMVHNGFLTKKDREKLLFSTDLDEIHRFIKDYEAPEIRQYK